MLKTARLSLLFLVFACCSATGFAQDISASIDSVFTAFANKPPTEKLYLHTDRNIYATGGTIWFRGYLVTASGNFPGAFSNFIYVELFDQADSLVCRKKIKKTDGVFSGNIKLDPGLPEGSYFIRAYSTWMLNAGIDYVFYKAIHIGNLQTHKVSSKLEIVGDEAGKKSATVYFADKNGEPVADTRVKCTLHKGTSKTEVLKRKTGDDGKINFDWEAESDSTANQFIEVEFEDSPTEYSNKFFLEKEEEGGLDVQFFPEGGDLIAEVGNRVAFKATGSDGYSREIWGFVRNSKKDTVAIIESQHCGMGSFYLVPETGEEYYAEIRDAENKIITVALPRHLEKGVALSVVNNRKSLLLNVRQKDFNAVGTYSIMAHAGERLLFSRELDDIYYKIPLDIMPEGIVNFVLLNENKEAVSSRMVLIRNEQESNLLVQPDQENYKRRAKVGLTFSVQREDTAAYNGSFSLAVTDDLVVEHDSLSDNIFSNLLLTSELKGYIENPGFYFLNNADSTRFFLDLLMLTQGWRRFDINELLQHGPSPAKYFLELGQTLSGKYDKMLLQRNKPTEITALAVDPFITASAYTDENSRFIFNELDFPDSTMFTVQAQRFTNIKQEPAGFITFDKDTFPAFQHLGFIPVKNEGFTGKMRENATERVYYEDGGKMIVLDEIRVDATDKTKNTLEKDYGISSTVFDEDRIAHSFPTPQPLERVIRTLSGVSRIENSNVYLARGNGAAEILVDGMEQTMDDIRDLYSDDIDHIAVIAGAGAAVYSRRGGGGGGVIIINLKIGLKSGYELKGVKKITPLGYQKPVEFYVPKYEVDSIRLVKQPDMRSTVYWNPKITVQAGIDTIVNFYTADPSTSYTYIIEGIGEDGQIYRSVGKLRREDE